MVPQLSAIQSPVEFLCNVALFYLFYLFIWQFVFVGSGVSARCVQSAPLRISGTGNKLELDYSCRFHSHLLEAIFQMFLLFYLLLFFFFKYFKRRQLPQTETADSGDIIKCRRFRLENGDGTSACGDSSGREEVNLLSK